MALLRRDCAWKADQTHLSLARYLLEETYEVVEAIESGSPDHLREELGDLLLQVYFHAAIAAEDGEYDIEDVAADLIAKLRRRNPHVFAPETVAAGLDAVGINEQWERIKATEKRRTGVMAGVPEELPALVRAVKALERLERTGRPVEDASGSSVGDRLLALAIEAHRDGLDPEQELRAAVRRLTSD
ncbi:nucleoside triphosphate pyrophosphohydrolase [Nocardioides marmoriginsengisoli]|uniref:Nucleoside triphosphate pyrophosphohydrolase n=2 Tax=Nocardioides marmoriginsengisoli TaxID=661483 RepID=A0A3N0CEB0_9ACTN|nr:nucleoside triphosphate pyrophosphohydrolase [Nocardioides marmoriginsengisoli]